MSLLETIMEHMKWVAKMNDAIHKVGHVKTARKGGIFVTLVCDYHGSEIIEVIEIKPSFEVMRIVDTPTLSPERWMILPDSVVCPICLKFGRA